MIIVLCEPDDTSALWLVQRLRAHDREAQAVLPEELHTGSQLAVRIGNGSAHSETLTANGLHIDDQTVSLIINRMQWFPTAGLVAASDEDTIYAAEEIRAAIVAWCAAFAGPVLSLPLPYAANGNAVSDLHWRCRASEMGIDSAPMSVGSSQQVRSDDVHYQLAMAVGRDVLAPEGETLSDDIREATHALAAAYGQAWFAALFQLYPECSAQFHGVPVQPALQPFGEPMIDSMLQWMDTQ